MIMHLVRANNLMKRIFYKVVTEDEDIVEEFGWISNTEFCVWISYYNLFDFMDSMKNIFGYGMFDDGGFNANMQSDGVCIDLCEMIGDYLEIEEVFSKEKYQH